MSCCLSSTALGSLSRWKAKIAEPVIVDAEIVEKLFIGLKFVQRLVEYDFFNSEPFPESVVEYAPVLTKRFASATLSIYVTIVVALA